MSEVNFKVFIQDNSDPADADMKELGLNYTRVIAYEGERYLGSMTGWLPREVSRAIADRLLFFGATIPTEDL